MDWMPLGKKIQVVLLPDAAPGARASSTCAMKGMGPFPSPAKQIWSLTYHITENIFTFRGWYLAGVEEGLWRGWTWWMGHRRERREMRKCLLLHQWWCANWNNEKRLCLLIILMNVIPSTFLWHSERFPVMRNAGKASKKGEEVLCLQNPRDWAVMHIPAESERCTWISLGLQHPWCLCWTLSKNGDRLSPCTPLGMLWKKEQSFFLSSISFERIQMHIFYKTLQDFEFSGETLKEKTVQKSPLELKWNLSYLLCWCSLVGSTVVSQ